MSHICDEFLISEVEAELRGLLVDVQARFLGVARLIQTKGVEHVQGKLWEMRMTGRDGVSRALYVTGRGRRVVVVRVFVKKTQRMPPREIRLALQRAEGLR